MEELLDILGFVHERNIIHRDVKPANIMRRNSDKKLVLIDFGAVKEVVTGKTETVAIQSGGYTPPEQAIGRPRFASDVYSVGIMGIQVLTGLDPQTLTRDSEDEIIWRKYAQVSSDFGDVLAKMVKEHFPNRYKNANIALKALRSCSSSPLRGNSPPFSVPQGQISAPVPPTVRVTPSPGKRKQSFPRILLFSSVYLFLVQFLFLFPLYELE
ncbi:MAG: protein kinase [Prochloron sp. SP5CPC1]|nr:protein kinase [Candidatus Paraprochloron terpiosi SP5CPC1]